MQTCRALLFMLLIVSLPALGGCLLPGRTRDTVPPEPPSAHRTQERGHLLDAEIPLLRPDAGRNGWRMQGDGLSGFTPF